MLPPAGLQYRKPASPQARLGHTAASTLCYRHQTGEPQQLQVFWRSGTIWLDIRILAQGLNLGGLGVALGNLRVPCGMASYSARIRDSFSERSGLPEETGPAPTLLRWLKRLGRRLDCP